MRIQYTIDQRPDKVNKRNEFGHWEIDTILSSRGQSKQCLATFVERRSRFIWAIKISDRTKKSMNKVFSTFMNQFSSSVKFITVDHGKEFSGYQELNKNYNLPVYFCHPYSPWARGSNEYFNRKLRWFFPKKTNFNLVS
ncbi:IS30 family transposase [Weissella coleopterorum]|uniref:IS30 family transposase n=1 Tax=Weissella coleopterorum TaxID=2714949 RepID=A0A6G8AZJ5_9LACO|nr:IS30 family transposase [Weissella coleopterorum]